MLSFCFHCSQRIWVIPPCGTHIGISRRVPSSWACDAETRETLGDHVMKSSPNLSALIERCFTERLMRQRQVSQHTIASYRDTFRLLLGFVQARLRKPPSSLDLRDLDAALISAFLEELEKGRSVSARTRNL